MKFTDETGDNLELQLTAGGIQFWQQAGDCVLLDPPALLVLVEVIARTLPGPAIAVLIERMTATPLPRQAFSMEQVNRSTHTTVEGEL